MQQQQQEQQQQQWLSHVQLRLIPHCTLRQCDVNRLGFSL
jgi:hypothetical protein